jgi:dimethylaniline monooxygenase (N-oxide forming)
MSDRPITCVIGAGSSGITVVKALKDRGLPVECFELSDRVGGNWVFGNKNGVSSAYRGLYINTSRDRMQYADYPMPDYYPDFPHHTQIAAYFEDYVDTFGLREHIEFETGVEHVTRRDDGVWEVRISTGETREYDVVAVANGHHWDPAWPDPPFPGEFDGTVLHAHHYIDAGDWHGKNVVVLGMGNSAMDIAVEASEVANKVFLASRRGAHVIPKYMFGRPLDQTTLDPRIPWRIRRRIMEIIHRLSVGRMSDYGLPEPDHRLLEAHPTVSGRILDRLGHGAITWKPNIARLEGDRVRFADGSVEQADVIVYCTGYKVTFPFFDEDFISAPDNDLPLFLRMFKPDIPGVAFIGLMQPLGAIMPLAEAQGKWLAAMLRGEYRLPEPKEMEAAIRRDREQMRKRYVPSKRHTMQVDYDDFLYEMRRERERGAKRAAKHGFVPQIQPRARSGQRPDARAERTPAEAVAA